MIEASELLKEIKFRTSRSSGKGGQSVNKVSSKVELIFDVNACQIFSKEEKLLIVSKAGSFLKDDNCIHIICQQDRSQYMNKKKAIEKFLRLITKCLKPIKNRIEIQISQEEKEKRLAEKKTISDKKRNRMKPKTL